MKKRNPEDIRKNINLLLDELEEANEEELKDLNKKKIEQINEVETYKKPKKGFVVSAVLYPLLVLFLAILLGMLSMSDTRKRILDKMKLEIGDSLFDDGECSCETLSSKLDYLLQHGVGGGTSYSNNGMALSVTGYETFDNLPNVGNNIGNIAVITDTEISNYYLSSTVPKSPKNGTVWVVQDRNSEYYITSDYSKIGISYAMQYICDEGESNCEWQIKKAYVYDEGKWNLLYYVPVSNGEIDLSGTDINAEIVHTYGYTGEYQKFTATFSGYYQVELWGAQGGSYSSGGGGLGSYTSGRVYLNAGETIYIYVGNQPSSVVGGWNGGGNGSSITAGSAGGGGGATDVRLVSTSAKNLWDEFDSLKSRIMVAAGGGGGNYYTSGNYGQGGAGGGLIGYSGTINAGSASPGSGALQTYGGFSQYDTAAPDITKGSFGKGGQSQNTSWSTAGGGGGYYGGGGGSYTGGTGGGGSSYISGHEGCNSISEESTYNNLIFTGKSLNYNNYFFENTIMIDGQGYSWTNSKTSKINMPTHDGTSIMTGNSGNGYAKITLTDIMVISDSKLSQHREAKEKVWNFTYSNNYEEFEAKKTGIYQVELWGAQGGSYSSGVGGKGAYTYGKIYLTSGTKLYVYVGNQPIFTLGGYNGGGTGYSINSGSAGGGGGATDIRLISGLWNNFDSLKSRIMVAAGGGGGCYYSLNNYGQGGAGGGLNGYSGTINAGGASPGSGGMINIGGESNYDLAAITTTSGSFGIGGKSQSTSWSTAGGGGGYYGGGGGSYAGASGGGGSSYISGHAGCSTISDDSLSASIIHTGSAYHKSNYYFYDTEMIDGQGYTWTTYKLTSSGMPVVNSNTIQLGQSGNGYAKIMLLEEIDENPNVINDKYFSYEYNGKYQKFTAPKTGIYQIELWGAEGTTYSGGSGGKGAYTSGEINLTSGTNLYIYVGSSEKGPKALDGGWNGGGSGSSISNGSSGGGGGATDVRITPTTGLTIWNNFDSLKSRIMVAAGGGGGCYYSSNHYGQGGGGGGLIGYSGTTNTGGASPGTGGTQVGAGFSSYDGNAKSLTIGGLGYGGQSQHTSWSTAGGGGGYYGGGGGSYAGGAGGGGSSYISGHAGCIGTTSSGNLLTQTYSSLEDSINYTGYKFVNTLVIDGQGYPWSTVKSGSRSGMPSFNGILLQNGNTGNGYAKITYLGE